MGLTAVQCQVMQYLSRALAEKKDTYPADLERDFHLKKPTVSGILKRMEEKEFVTFEADNEDKRKKKVVLTPKSKEITKKLDADFEYIEKALLDGISEEELGETKKTLIKMLDNINKYIGEYEEY